MRPTLSSRSTFILESFTSPGLITTAVKTALGRLLCLSLILGLLPACDFEHVGVGEWDIEIVSDMGSEYAVWSISPDGKLSIQGGIEAYAQDVELVGSQIMWSLDTPSIESPGEVSQINFRGTVNGNELAGTLFTRQGNFGVYGSRRR